MTRARRVIFLAWESHHAEIFDALTEGWNAVFFPVNQKAAAPWLVQGRALALPPFWTLYCQADLDAADQEANRYTAQWHGSLLLEANAARAWIWAREATYLKTLLASLVHTLGETPHYLVPRPKRFKSKSWHDAQWVPLAVMEMLVDEGATVDWLNYPDRPPPAPAATLSESPPESSQERWLLLSTFGIPDLADHVTRLLAQGSWSVLLLLDPADPLPAGILESLVASCGVRVRAAYLDRAMLPKAATLPPTVTDRLGRWICETGPDVAQIGKQIEALVAQVTIAGCIVSDHHAVQTLILRRLCAARRLPLCVLPHSVFPLEGVFALSDKSGPNEICVAPTRRAAMHLAASGKHRLAARPLASPRYRPKFLRFLRRLRFWLSMEQRPLRVGVVVTSGEELSAPDVALVDISESLRALCEAAGQVGRPVQLHVRLRALEDRAEVLGAMLGAGAQAVAWERSSRRSPLEFLQEMDVVVEVGTPGSVTLESFAQMVPFLRVGTAGPRRAAFMLPANLVPRLAGTPDCRELRWYFRRARSRVILGLRQFFHLVYDTQPEIRFDDLFFTASGNDVFSGRPPR